MKKTQFYFINALENALLFATNTNGDEVKQLKQEARETGYNSEALYNIAKNRALTCLCSE